MVPTSEDDVVICLEEAGLKETHRGDDNQSESAIASTTATAMTEISAHSQNITCKLLHGENEHHLT